MKLSAFKEHLTGLGRLAFELPDGKQVPSHFHVTEIGEITKKFIDCGGTIREERVISFQLWEANDYDHRLAPEKLKRIIALAEQELNLGDQEIEVEYQGPTIGKYGLAFNGNHFLLTAKTTDCLAADKCGIPDAKPRIRLSDLQKTGSSCCEPGSGCC